MNRALTDLEFNMFPENRALAGLEFNMSNPISQQDRPRIVSVGLGKLSNGKLVRVAQLSNGKRLILPLRK